MGGEESVHKSVDNVDNLKKGEKSGDWGGGKVVNKKIGEERKHKREQKAHIHLKQMDICFLLPFVLPDH